MGLTVFAQRLRQAREAKGLKQNELAKLVGVTPVTISSYEKSDTEGNGKKPTLEKALTIAEKLNVSLDWLSGLSDTNITKKSITDFSVEDFFKSVLTILLEKSAITYSERHNPNVLFVECPDVIDFMQEANNLIGIYRSGTLPPDMFEACIERLLSKYGGKYTINSDTLKTKKEPTNELPPFPTSIDEPLPF